MSTVVTTGVSETPAVAADLFYYKQYFVEENNERVTKRYHYTTSEDRLSAVQHFLAGARNTTTVEVAKNFHPAAARSIADWLLSNLLSKEVKGKHSGFDADFGTEVPEITVYDLGVKTYQIDTEGWSDACRSSSSTGTSKKTSTKGAAVPSPDPAAASEKPQLPKVLT